MFAKVVPPDDDDFEKEHGRGENTPVMVGSRAFFHAYSVLQTRSAVLYMRRRVLSSKQRAHYGVALGAAVGVKPATGVRGVLVGGRVAVGVTILTGIDSTWPT